LTFGAITRIGVWLDEKEHAEKQARASEQRLASVIAASADAILILDPQGHIETSNRGAESLFDYASSQIDGRPLSDLLGDGESAEVEFRWLTDVVRQAGFVRNHETTCRNVQGKQVAVELTASLLTGEAREPLGMSVILRDITDRKHREEEIRKLNASLNEQVAERTRELAEKVEQLARANADLQKLDQMRSEFVSLVSHQIRAPLTNMRGAAERMQADCPAMTATCSRMFTILDQQVARLDQLVQVVLNAARIEAGDLALDLEPISILPVAQQVVDQLRARTSNRPFCLPTKTGLPLVLGDRHHVAEVLANLLDNADKYSPPGKDVVIDVRADQAEVTLSVRDYGAGLPSGDLARVFDKFYRADSSDSQVTYGYGLGLYVCRQLVEAQGGRIWAENAPGGGAIFIFTLPVAR
jgi:PAS domain S-box-containing protein